MDGEGTDFVILFYINILLISYTYFQNNSFIKSSKDMLGDIFLNKYSLAKDSILYILQFPSCIQIDGI